MSEAGRLAADRQAAADRKEQAISEYRQKVLSYAELEASTKRLRETCKEVKKEYEKTEEDLKALQSVGQIIGEVLRQLDDERCEISANSCLCYFPSIRGSVSLWRVRSHNQPTVAAVSMPVLCLLFLRAHCVQSL